MNYEPGNIIVADLLFSEQIGVKRRPLLVISNSKYNLESQDIIVLRITSANKKTNYDVTLTNKDISNGTLKSDSFIMVDFPATIEKNNITQIVGKVSVQKLNEVKQKMKELYNM